MINSNFLVAENCQKIRIDDYVRQARNSLKKAIVEAQVLVNDQRVNLSESKTHFGGVRFWFECPECKKRRGILFQDFIGNRIACRICFGLKYRK